MLNGRNIIIESDAVGISVVVIDCAAEFKITVAYLLIEEIEADIDHVLSGIEAASGLPTVPYYSWGNWGKNTTCVFLRENNRD